MKKSNYKKFQGILISFSVFILILTLALFLLYEKYDVSKDFHFYVKIIMILLCSILVFYVILLLLEDNYIFSLTFSLIFFFLMNYWLPDRPEHPDIVLSKLDTAAIFPLNFNEKNAKTKHVTAIISYLTYSSINSLSRPANLTSERLSIELDDRTFDFRAIKFVNFNRTISNIRGFHEKKIPAGGVVTHETAFQNFDVAWSYFIKEISNIDSPNITLNIISTIDGKDEPASCTFSKNEMMATPNYSKYGFQVNCKGNKDE